jgi:hypothetical protein
LAEEALLVWGKEVVAPGNRIAQRQVAPRGVARTTDEERQALIKAVSELVGSKGFDPRRRQLDGQRQTIQLRARRRPPPPRRR